jgi:hypothetical protein
MMQWIQANQAMILIAWPILTAIFSLAYKALENNPRAHAIVSILSALGIDLPKLWDALGRLISGNPPGGGGTAAQLPGHVAKKDLPPVPPDRVAFSALRKSGTFMKRLAVCACLGLVTLTTACTAAQWQSFQTAAASFIAYVQTFVQAAETVWAMIAPLLGDKATVANAAFNDAVLALTNALGVLQDAVQAANATQQPLDLAALMKPVQDAVARVMAVVAQWQPVPSMGVHAPLDSLQARATTIARWH